MMPLFFLEKKLGLFKSKKGSHFSITSFSVPGAGLEPARPNGHKILSLACLPIPPPGQNTF